jgi:hypothetical protein
VRTQNNEKRAKSNKPAICRLSCRDYVSCGGHCRAGRGTGKLCLEDGRSGKIGPGTANAANYRRGRKAADTGHPDIAGMRTMVGVGIMGLRGLGKER